MHDETNMASATQRSERTVDEVLAGHPFTAGLKPEHIRTLSQNAMRVAYQPGEIIFREGDPANRFYLIERGAVLLEANPAAASSTPVQTLGPGEVLGWSWLFPPYTWHFTARVTQPTTAIFFYGTRLRQHCDDNPELGYELMKRIANVLILRLQATRQMLLAS